MIEERGKEFRLTPSSVFISIQVFKLIYMLYIFVIYVYLEGLDSPSHTNKYILTEYAGIGSSIFIGITIFKLILVLFS